MSTAEKPTETPANAPAEDDALDPADAAVEAEADALEAARQARLWFSRRTERLADTAETLATLLAALGFPTLAPMASEPHVAAFNPDEHDKPVTRQLRKTTLAVLEAIERAAKADGV